MKKILSVLSCSAILMSAFAVSASAVNDSSDVKLPFEVTAPSDVSLSWTQGSDSDTTMSAAWSMNDSMCKWMSENADPTTHDATMEKLLKDYGIDELFINAQIDWAIDDPVNGWHWTKYWDGIASTDEEGHKTWTGYGYDENYQIRTGDWDLLECLLYASTVNQAWILRGLTIDNNPENPEDVRESHNVWFYGNDLIPGLKNQLKDDQYTLVEIDSETHDQAIHIDYTQHTAYIRVRWGVEVRDKDGNDVVIFSDWSETAGYGKDVKAFEPYTKESLAPPVITDLKYYPDDFNNYPQISVTLTVPEVLSSSLTEVSSRGGDLHVEWEARIPGGEWVGLQGGWEITAGEYVIALQNLASHIIEKNKDAGIENSDIILENGSPIELRARYFCSQYDSWNGEWLGEFYTDYSKVLTFGSQEMSHVDESVPDQSSKPSVSNPDKTESKCSLCHNCPAPIGICIWIWILIIVVIIVIVVIIIVASKKKKDDKKDNSDS